ncbi:MAG: hypothetical protein ACKONH_05585, partial [Planctomycetia bacterium]
VPPAERGGLKDRFFSEILPRETVTVADANAIACEHDDFLAAIPRNSKAGSSAASAAAGPPAWRRAAAIDPCPSKSARPSPVYTSGGTGRPAVSATAAAEDAAHATMTMQAGSILVWASPGRPGGRPPVCIGRRRPASPLRP